MKSSAVCLYSAVAYPSWEEITYAFPGGKHTADTLNFAWHNGGSGKMPMNTLYPFFRLVEEGYEVVVPNPKRGSITR